MSDYTQKIREIARKLLSEGKVDVVMGFREGTMPLMAEPCLVTDVAGVDQLVFNSFCGVNLANYLPKRKDRIAVVAKGCDSRNMALHIAENQIKRDQLVLIGAPCTRMVDRRKVAAAVDNKDITSVVETDGKLTVRGPGYEKVLDKESVLQDNCAICIHRNPVMSDEMLAEPLPEQEADRYADVRDVEAMTPAERFAHFQELISGCIRCYACRNACPLCYCPTCFVDESKPQWVGKSDDPTDTLTFHLLRAFHCAGRCTDCGACERACPVGIKVRQMTKKLEKDCKELFDWESGMSPDVRPPLDTFRPDDPGKFIK